VRELVYVIKQGVSMNKYEHLKPRYRNKLRSYLGKKYYTTRRYIDWMIKHNTYASKKETLTLPYGISSHKTPIYRQLKDVDMWMQYNKAENLKIAIKEINGVVIKPGQVFSYCVERRIATDINDDLFYGSNSI